MSQDCIFCKIARGEIPSRKVYEDDAIFAFHDQHPAAPVHFLIVPKVHLENLYDAGLRTSPCWGGCWAWPGSWPASRARRTASGW